MKRLSGKAAFFVVELACPYQLKFLLFLPQAVQNSFFKREIGFG